MTGRAHRKDLRLRVELERLQRGFQGLRQLRENVALCSSVLGVRRRGQGHRSLDDQHNRVEQEIARVRGQADENVGDYRKEDDDLGQNVVVSNWIVKVMFYKRKMSRV